jgi:hypothetical protein
LEVEADVTVTEFKRMTDWPNGRPWYAVDHIVPLARGGADKPSNIHARTVPVWFISFLQLSQNPLMEFTPDPGRLPVTQPSPARHTAHPKNRREQFPRNPAAQYIEDAFQSSPI